MGALIELQKDVPRLNMKQIQSLFSISDGGSSVLEKVYMHFKNIKLEKIASIKEGLQQNDFERIAKELHSFKVSCHNVGAGRASSLCQEMQFFIQNKDFENSKWVSIVQSLEKELDFAMQDIDVFIQNHHLVKVA